MSRDYVVFWNKDDQTKLLTWWASLKSNPGWRAELRRAASPADVLLCQGFRYLSYELAGYWTSEQNLLGLAAVAGVIAHIEVDVNKSFSQSCALAVEGKDKPAVSELRFSQLQKSRSLDELYTRMIRVIHLLKKQASAISIAESILHWVNEYVNGEIETNPRDRILVRWGLEYFRYLPKKTITKKNN